MLLRGADGLTATGGDGTAIALGVLAVVKRADHQNDDERQADHGMPCRCRATRIGGAQSHGD